MWFKKKSVLQADGNYDTEKSADRTTDMRTTEKYYYNYSSSINNSGLPSAADAGNYFYLPSLGYYFEGKLGLVGDYGNYWSSSAVPIPGVKSAYYLKFYSGYASVYFSNPFDGYRVDGPK